MKIDFKRMLVRGVVSTLLFAVGVSFVPYWWCLRGAGGWYRGDAAVQEELARGVETWVTGDLGRNSFHTGSRQFDGEWLFGIQGRGERL